jgi:hypothetical protein
MENWLLMQTFYHGLTVDISYITMY